MLKLRGPITCAEVDRELSAYEAGGLPAERAVELRRHLETCGECSRLARESAQLAEAVHRDADAWQPQIAPNASAQIQRRVYEQMRSQLRWHTRWQTVVHIAGNGLGLAAMLAIIVAAYFVWQANLRPLGRIVVPGGHHWAAELHDAQGTGWVDVSGPRQPAPAWEYQQRAGFSGGVAVAADGTVFIAANDKTLHALTPSGAVRWTSALPHQPIGAPALGGSGRIFVADNSGGLTALTPEGRVLWTLRAESTGLSSPIVGPDEDIYFATFDELVAVASDGVLRWRTPLPTFSYVSSLPRLSPDGRYLFFADTVLDARTGEVLFGPTPEFWDSYLVGANGQMYHHQGLTFTQWWPGVTGTQVAPALAVGQRFAERSGFPNMAGVAADGVGWVYFSDVDSNNLAWLLRDDTFWAQTGPPFSLIGNLSTGRTLAVDREGLNINCQQRFRTPPTPARCFANRRGSPQPLWEWQLAPSENAVIGGALTPAGLYLATDRGRLIALRDVAP